MDNPASAPKSIDRAWRELSTKGTTTRAAPIPPSIAAIIKVMIDMR
ncbi:MAG: hypothetical protein GWN79_08565 [Actinobacteria bacterium]|nr:hypothetical protein [Actinomycetota bacterium]NIS31033.1 hypothetical protein [Actinomycetota bacterium]NIT95445.1 hypothetical protein [Actinomycetota bacterium]NIU19132.1 hypothetical protein [Actinomycetota bacterium]NIU66203.1 hypothetical protein [Actinomycetota bacterium]